MKDGAYAYTKSQPILVWKEDPSTPNCSGSILHYIHKESNMSKPSWATYFFFRHSPSETVDEVKSLNKQVAKLRGELGKSARRLAATRKRLKDAGIVAPQPKKQLKVKDSWSFKVSPDAKRPEIDYLEIIHEIQRTKAKCAALRIDIEFGRALVELKVQSTSTCAGRVMIYNNVTNQWVDYMSITGNIKAKYVDFSFGNSYIVNVQLQY